MINWFLDGKVINSLEDFDEEIFGFVYLIENKTKQKRYIGKKQVLSKIKKSLTGKELEGVADKRLKKYKEIIKESNWKTYCGSNKDLLADIKAGDLITRKIVRTCNNKTELTYFETKFLFSLSVLESEEYYNDNILGKFYKLKI